MRYGLIVPYVAMIWVSILGWELANEPRSSDRSGAIVRAWAASMSGHLKSVDPNHLVGTGESQAARRATASWSQSPTMRPSGR